MKKILIFFITSVLVSSLSFSQEVDDGDDEMSNFGPNKLHFLHAYVNTGFMILPSEGEGGEIIYGKSHSITTGIRYKLRIVDVFSMTAGINYTYNVWHLKQIDSKQIPNNVLYDKEKILTNNLGADLALRFNIGKRGNTIGNYIDLGTYGEWNYGNARKIFINMEMPGDPTGYELYIATQKNVAFLEKLNYGLLARIGYGKYSLFGKYRMSDMFTPDFKGIISNTEFPRLIIGIEIGLHK